MREQIKILSNAEIADTKLNEVSGECRELTTQELDRVTGAYSALTRNIYTAEVDTGRRVSKR